MVLIETCTADYNTFLRMYNNTVYSLAPNVRISLVNKIPEGFMGSCLVMKACNIEDIVETLEDRIISQGMVRRIRDKTSSSFLFQMRSFIVAEERQNLSNFDNFCFLTTLKVQRQTF